MNNNYLIIDELDIFLNKAHWNDSRYKNFAVAKQKFYFELFKIFSELEINYFLIINSRFPNLEANKDHEIIYIENFNKDRNLQDAISKSHFEINKDKDGNFYITKFDILVRVKLSYKKFSNKKSSYLEKNNERIKYFFVNRKISIIQKKVISKVKQIIVKIKKRYYLLRMVGIFQYLTFSSEKIYKLSYKQFLKLMFEPKDSVNWMLRRKHLYLISKNKEYLHVGKIIKFLKNEKCIEPLKSNIVEVDTSKLFEEPIHLNRYFWEGGNNFFIYPIYFEFRKNVVPYKKANDYISKNKTPNIYSYEYYENLPLMSDEEVVKFLEKNPIEITNNYITSGRHRVSAMCGRIINGKDYLPIHIKIKF